MEVEEEGIGKQNEAFGSLVEAYPSFHRQRKKLGWKNAMW
ncbi:hypothetical protein SLEP1_g23673 [Rubroshorea leprosula]|uniref:Uncharacterized protein n=1 Tax=Rubroshorea leprosula TaxID=152421 RepID=A0AAV5JID4_9ROSI|nr:hypothetical protein SLEP1_g23673 [Rubroshorea leprosula]